jgi:hypothetical protein
MLKPVFMVLSLFASNAFSEQYAPDDERLADDPRIERSTEAVEAYIVHSGLDKLAKALDKSPKEIAPILDKTVDNIVKTGIKQMRAKGYTQYAGMLEQEYLSSVKGAITRAMNFIPLVGCVSYWISWVSCEIVSFSAGVFIICTPISSMVESIMTEFVAPALSDRVYTRANSLQ